MEFTEDEWRGLAEHCRQRGVLFLSSPFSIEAVDLLERIGQPFWKIASGEVSNTRLLDRVLDTGAPVLLSTGMSPLAETDAAVARVQARGVPVGVLQCTTAYPVPAGARRAEPVPFFRERYGCWVGLSDHSATIYPGLAGAALGIDLLEVHVALSRRDVRTRRRGLGDDRRAAAARRRRPVHRADAGEPGGQGRVGARHRAAAAAVHAQRRGRRRSPPAPCSQREHLAIKKPGTGLPPERLDDVVGRRLARAVERRPAARRRRRRGSA